MLMPVSRETWRREMPSTKMRWRMARHCSISRYTMSPVWAEQFNSLSGLYISTRRSLCLIVDGLLAQREGTASNQQAPLIGAAGEHLAQRSSLNVPGWTQEAALMG